MPPFLTELLTAVNENGINNFELLIFGYLGLLWLSILIWVTRDVLSRSNSLFFQAFSILLTLILPIIGVLFYLIIRPSKTQTERYYEQLEAELLESGKEKESADGPQCDKCFTEIEADYNICPNCSFQLKKSCYGCKKSYPKHWNRCPYCGRDHKERVTKPKRNRRITTKENKEKEDKKSILT